jgi:hypothetical protein
LVSVVTIADHCNDQERSKNHKKTLQKVEFLFLLAKGGEPRGLGYIILEDWGFLSLSKASL